MAHEQIREFRALVDCCRWPSSNHGAPISSDVFQDFDWELFRQLAVRHHVEGLVAKSIGANISCPPVIRSWFKSQAETIARTNLLQASESLRIASKLQANDIPVVFLKGSTLGALAYGSILIKRSKDVDILVPLDRCQAAGAMLTSLGYEWVPPSRGWRGNLSVWHARSKESVWRHLESSIIVELHTALSDSPDTLKALDPIAATRQVAITDHCTLPTLPYDKLVAYLFVHGASSAWFRLKWLADLAALLKNESPAAIGTLHSRAKELGGGNSSDQALLLLAELFHLRLPHGLHAELRSRPISRWMYSLAGSMLQGRWRLKEPVRSPFGTLNIHCSQIGMVPGSVGKGRELLRQIRAL